MKIEELAQEIDLIKKRNQRLEIDKAWETSIVRKILLLVFTYLSIGLYLNAMNIKDPWLNAVVPSIGFLLSTLTLPYFKDLWRRYIYKKK